MTRHSPSGHETDLIVQGVIRLTAGKVNGRHQIPVIYGVALQATLLRTEGGSSLLAAAIGFVDLTAQFTSEESPKRTHPHTLFSPRWW